jgi:hypothetical protein
MLYLVLKPRELLDDTFAFLSDILIGGFRNGFVDVVYRSCLQFYKS